MELPTGYFYCPIVHYFYHMIYIIISDMFSLAGRVASQKHRISKTCLQHVSQLQVGSSLKQTSQVEKCMLHLVRFILGKSSGVIIEQAKNG